MNDPHSDAAAVLSQVVPLGESLRAAELGAAVSDQISNRPPPPRSAPDPETLTALRSLASNPGAVLGDGNPDVTFSPLQIVVDVNALLEDHGDSATWEILGKLKDLFGGPT